MWTVSAKIVSKISQVFPRFFFLFHKFYILTFKFNWDWKKNWQKSKILNSTTILTTLVETLLIEITMFLFGFFFFFFFFSWVNVCTFRGNVVWEFFCHRNIRKRKKNPKFEISRPLHLMTQNDHEHSGVKRLRYHIYVLVVPEAPNFTQFRSGLLFPICL